MPPLAFNLAGQIVTASPIWVEKISDEDLIELGQLQGMAVGCGCVSGIQLRVKGELMIRGLMWRVQELVYRGQRVPEELT